MTRRGAARSRSNRALERGLALLIAGLTVCVLVAMATSLAGPRAPGRNLSAEAYMLELVNTTRADYGLPALATAPDVAQVAWLWSFEMSRSGEFEHNPHFPDQICCWELVTENVAFTEPHGLWHPGDPVERLTRELHEALLDSPGHRANILHPHVDQVGIGVHVDRQGGVWITQNFRRSAPTD